MGRLIVRMAAAGLGILISLWNIWGAVYNLLAPVPFAWMRNVFSDFFGLVIFLPLLCFCIYKLAMYIGLLRQGPRNAYGMIWEYSKTETTDSDGDTVTSITHTIRLNDGEMINARRIPQSAFQDGMMWPQFITPGTYVILAWYEKPFIPVALRPDPAHPVPATDDERHRIIDPTWRPEPKMTPVPNTVLAGTTNGTPSAVTSGDAVTNGTGADANNNGHETQADTKDADTKDSESTPSIEKLNPKPFKRLNAIFNIIIVFVLAGVMLRSTGLTPFGIEGIYKRMALGVAFGCFAVWTLVRMVAQYVLLSVVGKTTTMRDHVTGDQVPLPQDTIAAEKKTTLIMHLIGAAIVAVIATFMLIGPAQTLIAGPQSVSVTYQGVERREETDEDDDTTSVYADFRFRTENGETLTITTDWNWRSTIEKQAGDNGNRLLLTYWGSQNNFFDHKLIFDNAKPDPKYS